MHVESPSAKKSPHNRKNVTISATVDMVTDMLGDSSAKQLSCIFLSVDTVSLKIADVLCHIN